jgi:hypothetical protein
MKAYDGADVSLHALLLSALDTDEWSDSTVVFANIYPGYGVNKIQFRKGSILEK